MGVLKKAYMASSGEQFPLQYDGQPTTRKLVSIKMLQYKVAIARNANTISNVVIYCLVAKGACK